MIMKEDERVTKSTKLSAGRLRERWLDTERIRAVKVWRHASGKDSSKGSTGAYHHLDCIRQVYTRGAEDILDIVPNDGVCQLREGCCRLWLELGIVQGLPRVQLQGQI
jgi:hypothetical protein